MIQVAIKAQGLSKIYPGVKALDNISLELPKGSIIGLLGPNGSGKSTFLKLIAGLVRPTSGSLEVLGQPVTRKSKKEISFLPEINHLYNWMTIQETLKFWGDFYSDWNQELAIELVGFMNLKTQTKVKHLSKGMKARLKLIISLARKASIILLDEPFSGIDPQSRGRIMDALTAKYDFEDQTLIISTHDVLQAEQIFDYVILLEYGKIKTFAEADDLRSQYGTSINELIKEVFE